MSEKSEQRETARLDHCMNCGSTSVRNYVYFQQGGRVRVYLECTECGSYVARYTLFGYTSDEPYDELLQIMRSAGFTSGRRAQKMVEAFDEDVQQEFEHVRDLVRREEDQRRMEKIIEEDYPESLG